MGKGRGRGRCQVCGRVICSTKARTAYRHGYNRTRPPCPGSGRPLRNWRDWFRWVGMFERRYGMNATRDRMPPAESDVVVLDPDERLRAENARLKKENKRLRAEVKSLRTRPRGWA